MSTAVLAGAGQRHTHRVLSLMVSSAVRDGRLPTNVAAGVRLPRVGVSKQRFLSHTQIRRLSAAAGEFLDVVVLVLAFTGLRWGELAALRVRDLDLERRRVHVARSMTEIRGRAVFGTPKNQVRTAASLAIDAVANVEAVQRMHGHASAAMTFDVSAGFFADDLDEVARVLDAVYTRSEARVSSSPPKWPAAHHRGGPTSL